MARPQITVTPTFNFFNEKEDLHPVWISISIRKLGRDRIQTSCRLPRAALVGGVISTETELGKAVHDTISKMSKAVKDMFEISVAKNEIITPQDLGNYLKTYSGGEAYSMLLGTLMEDYIQYKNATGMWAPNPKNPDQPGASEKAVNYAVRAFKKFMYREAKVEDILIDKVTMRNLTRFEVDLRKGDKDRAPLSPNTVALYLKELMALFQYAFEQGFIKSFPFENFNSDRLRVTTEGNPELLQRKMSKQDLARIKDTQIEGNPELERLRLLFLFQTWTGMAYIDMFLNASVKNIMGVDLSGNKSIIYTRQKTSEPAIVPVFDDTESIINKLGRNISPGGYNTYARGLRKMWAHFGIKVDEKKVTHVGRHLFGNEMLEMGFTMDSVSRMMGHSSIKQTEKVYAKVNTDKVFADLEKIRKQNAAIQSKQAHLQSSAELSA